MSLLQGDKAVGFELLSESTFLHEQCVGPIHPLSAKIYNQLAMCYFDKDDQGVANALLEKGLIVLERTVGFDHPDTIQSFVEFYTFSFFVTCLNSLFTLPILKQ